MAVQKVWLNCMKGEPRYYGFKLNVYKQGRAKHTDLVLEMAPPEVGHLKHDKGTTSISYNTNNVDLYGRVSPHHDQDAKPQSGTSSIFQSPKSGIEVHGCSSHLKKQDREPKLRIWLNQRPVTISKSISGCKTTVRNIQRPPWTFFAPLKSKESKNYLEPSFVPNPKLVETSKM